MFLFGRWCRRRCRRRLHRRGDRLCGRNVGRCSCEEHNDVIESVVSRNQIAITMKHTEMENSMDPKPQMDTQNR